MFDTTEVCNGCTICLYVFFCMLTGAMLEEHRVRVICLCERRKDIGFFSQTNDSSVQSASCLPLFY